MTASRMCLFAAPPPPHVQSTGHRYCLPHCYLWRSAVSSRAPTASVEAKGYIPCAGGSYERRMVLIDGCGLPKVTELPNLDPSSGTPDGQALPEYLRRVLSFCQSVKAPASAHFHPRQLISSLRVSFSRGLSNARELNLRVTDHDSH